MSISSFCNSQDRNIVLVIDTLEFVRWEDSIEFNILNSDFFQNSMYTDKTNIYKYPNYVNNFTVKSDSSILYIPIDNHYGYIKVSNVYSYDTIKINKLTQYSDC